MKCRVSHPEHECEGLARFVITWSDEDETPACQKGMLYVQQLAQEHKTIVKIEKMPPIVVPR